MKNAIIFILALCSVGFARADGDLFLPNIPGYATGTASGGKNSLDVNITSPISVLNPSDGPTGSAVPADANYVGANKAGILTGLLIGQQTMANSLACVLPSDQSAIPVTGTFSSASIGLTGAAVPGSANYAGFLDQSGHLAGAKVNASQALTVDGSAITQPVSAASLPLPSGASTSAKQPALGTAGSASSDVITVQGVASMTALKVDGSAVTQPVSSTQLPAALGQTTMSASLPVTLASNQSPLPSISDTSTSGTIVATNGTVTLSINGAGTTGIQISGTWSGSVNFNASTDGTNFFNIICMTPLGSAVGNASANGHWLCPTAGYQKIQLIGSAWISGTASVNAVASIGSVMQYPMSFVAGNFLSQVSPSNTANTTPWLFTVNQGGNSASVTASNALKVDGSAVTQPVSIATAPVLVAGSAIIGKVGIDQTTPGTTNLVSIGTNGTVQTKAPLNSTGSGSSAGATVSTVITLTAPANAIGAFLMNLDVSTTNMRWAVNRTAGATLGQQLQPARDVWIPTSHDISIIAESGTVTYDVQWISQ